MGLCNSSDIFEEKMNDLFNVLKYVRCIDDYLIISNNSFEDHINKLNEVLSTSKQKVFKVSAEKSIFTRNELEYLGFRITRQGIMPYLIK